MDRVVLADARLHFFLLVFFSLFLFLVFKFNAHVRNFSVKCKVTSLQFIYLLIDLFIQANAFKYAHTKICVLRNVISTL